MEKARVRFVEAYRAERLDTQVDAWQRAKAIREYCDALESEIDDASEIAEDERAWIGWAREYADSIAIR